MRKLHGARTRARRVKIFRQSQSRIDNWCLFVHLIWMNCHHFLQRTYVCDNFKVWLGSFNQCRSLCVVYWTEERTIEIQEPSGHEAGTVLHIGFFQLRLFYPPLFVPTYTRSATKSTSFFANFRSFVGESINIHRQTCGALQLVFEREIEKINCNCSLLFVTIEWMINHIFIKPS